MPAIDGSAGRTPALMFQGTGSNVGKSLIVAGLGRALTRRGLAVRPFKPQNMSNNAAVTADGGEIGRAQALQARACGVAPAADMNPVLLKPQSETGAQVVVQGRVMGNATARDYHRLKPELMPAVLESFGRLAGPADIVLVEGAGSPAEVNLRAGDIANMGFARAAAVPVVLVGDVDRGGVIAALTGTVALLEPAERALLRGCIVNRFRGDPALFTEGVAAIRRHAGLDCFGVVPWFDRHEDLPAEDAAALDNPGRERTGRSGDGEGKIRVAVPRFSRIANFDDLDPLAGEPDVLLEMVPPTRPLPVDADLVLLPGSKSTLADLRLLVEAGWDIDIRAHLRRGGQVLGLCGGYQMLGRRVADPDGVEGPPGEAAGLGLLDVDTVLLGGKALREVAGRETGTGAAVRGYEMHIGRTDGPDRARPVVEFDDGRSDGARSADGLVAGSYLHGLFAADEFRAAFLGALRPGRAAGPGHEARVEGALDALADHLEAALDIDGLLATARAG